MSEAGSTAKAEDAPNPAPPLAPDPPAATRGKRPLIAEIGIIVIGVLIALLAEQGVQWLNWRSQVSDARAALRGELGHNVVAIRKRLTLGRCIERRIGELETALAGWQSGTATRLGGRIGRPLSTNMQETVWAVMTSGEVAAQLPLDERLSYAQLYAGLQTLTNILVRERDIWAELQEFQDSGAPDPAARMRLRRLISQARWIDAAIGVTGRDALARMERIGATPQQFTPVDQARLEGLCDPLRRAAA